MKSLLVQDIKWKQKSKLQTKGVLRVSLSCFTDEVEDPYVDRIYNYENMAIQKYWKFYHQKMKIFR